MKLCDQVIRSETYISLIASKSTDNRYIKTDIYISQLGELGFHKRHLTCTPIQ